MNDNNIAFCHGPDGHKLTLEELPAPTIKRWVMRRKATVVAAVDGGLISKSDACERYGLSEEEYDTWEKLYQTYGKKGLRATRVKQYRNA